MKFISILAQEEEKDEIALTKILFGGRISSSALLLTHNLELRAFTSFFLSMLDVSKSQSMVVKHGS